MALFKPTFLGVGRLELHAVLEEDAPYRKRRATVVVRLQDCLSTARAPEEPCPAGCTAFHLNTPTCTYTLASSVTQQWLSAIWLITFQKDPGEAGGGFARGNDEPMMAIDIYASLKKEPALALNQYTVRIGTTEASLRCHLAGEYLMSVTNRKLVLLELNTWVAVYCWPYICIRKFGIVQGGFSIQAGRRCESGAGLFIFLSPRGKEIYQALIDNCSVERTSSAEPAAVHADPPPVPASRRPADPSSLSLAGALPVPCLYASVSFKARLPSSDSLDSMLRRDVVEWGGKEEDQLYHSLGAVNLESAAEGGVYHNWQTAKSAKAPPAGCGSSSGTQEWLNKELEGSAGSSVGIHSQSFKNRLESCFLRGQAQRQPHSSAGLQ